MEYNIVEKYIKFLIKEFNNFFKLVLRDNYSKKICDAFINKYIEVRYYDETDFVEEKDFINRINKEFYSVYEKLKDDKNDDLLKNIFALYGYLLCFDDTEVFEQEMDIINALVEDENIKIDYDETTKKSLKLWCRNFESKKEEFNKTIISKEFVLNEQRLCKNTFKLDLIHHVKVSNLYSEYAVNKVYNSGVVYEERLFITYILASYQALEDARNVDFTRKYVVDFPNSLFDKSKKIQRIFNIIDNVICKKAITLKISYTDYINYKDIVNHYIAEGFSFGVELDESFDFDLNNLIIFNYVFVSQNDDFYDMIMVEKNKLKTKIVVL